MKRKWEIDENTVVETTFGAFGKKRFYVNGIEVNSWQKGKTKNEFLFSLADGRPLQIIYAQRFIGQPTIELRVVGQLMIENGKEAIKCRSCNKVAKPYDRFCTQCGQAMPDAKDHTHQKYVKEATGAIKALAVLYAIFGVVMFFISKSQSSDALIKLQGMSPESVFPTPINGVTYTVSALMHQILWESWSVLIVNFILAAVMGGLALWGRRAPLAAVLVATATYVVVNVTNGIIDPKSIGQGFYMKIIIIVLLVRGIKSALALRTVNA